MVHHVYDYREGGTIAIIQVRFKVKQSLIIIVYYYVNKYS
jgi:hypothetical protein